jgi:hypothetical protein
MNELQNIFGAIGEQVKTINELVDPLEEAHKEMEQELIGDVVKPSEAEADGLIEIEK